MPLKRLEGNFLIAIVWQAKSAQCSGSSIHAGKVLSAPGLRNGGGLMVQPPLRESGSMSRECDGGAISDGQGLGFPAAVKPHVLFGVLPDIDFKAVGDCGHDFSLISFPIASRFWKEYFFQFEMKSPILPTAAAIKKRSAGS